MNDEQRHLLSVLRRPPLHLTAEQAAWALNRAPHDIPAHGPSRQMRGLRLGWRKRFILRERYAIQLLQE